MIEHVRAAALNLDPEPVAVGQIIDGTPTTAVSELGTFGSLDVGVWEMTAGAMSDTEADELFVVIAGSAEVEYVDSGVRATYGVGDVVQLHAGQRTVWRVADRIRKVYLAPAP